MCPLLCLERSLVHQWPLRAKRQYMVSLSVYTLSAPTITAAATAPNEMMPVRVAPLLLLPPLVVDDEDAVAPVAVAEAVSWPAVYCVKSGRE